MGQVRTSRIFYADILRALAIYAVIILHNAADYDDQFGSIPQSHWWAGAIWNGLVRFCVPLFVSLSGAFLLKPGKEVTIAEIFKKRLPKILIPLFFWSIIYIIYAGFESKEGINSIDWPEELKIFYQGPVIYHFWFLYMLIGIYLLYPIINLFITAAKPIYVRYFILVWFLSNCVIKIIDVITDTSFGVENNFFAEYVGYFVLGYYLTHYTFSKTQLRLMYILGIFGFIVSIFTSYLCIHFNFESRSELIESDFTPDVTLCVTALILWFKNRNYGEENQSAIKRSISQISQASFGIYLVHVLVMQIIFSDRRSYIDLVDGWHPAWAIPLKSLIILVVSFVIVKLLSQIPLLKKVVG